jgi:hypothetical protein
MCLIIACFCGNDRSALAVRQCIAPLSVLGMTSHLVTLTQQQQACPSLRRAARSAEATEGVDELRARLADMVAAPPARRTDAPLLLSVDHCFPIKGQGTVLTGTVLQVILLRSTKRALVVLPLFVQAPVFVEVLACGWLTCHWRASWFLLQ